MIEKLLEALRSLKPPLTAAELQDALWLAERFGPPPRAETPESEAAPPAEPSAAGSVGLAPPPEPGPAPPAVSAPPPSPVPEAGLFLADRIQTSPTEAVRVPAPPAIRSGLPLARALRPLRVRVDSASSMMLDEERTAERIAETALWQPVMVPRSELRFELALVVDDSASMPMWRQTVGEFHAVLRQSGAFRDIRVWRLTTGEDRAPRLLADDGTEHRMEVLADPARSRVVLLFSDCLGAAWQDGRVGGPLALWGAHVPLAIVQPLPERLWWRGGAATHLVELTAPLPGAPNSRLECRLRGGRGKRNPPGVAVPVLELSPRWFGPWSRLVAHGDRRFFGSALFTGQVADAEAPAPEPPDLTPLERVQRFHAAASPRAIKLASYLAAAPLRQPVMRLVQHAMLPESTTADLAEVQLSGLLRLADSSGGAEPGYEFHDGVRSVLLDGLRRGESMSVLRNVWNAVREHAGSTLDFPALLESLEHDGSELPPDHAFAQVAIEVLGRLGGRYAKIAKRLTSRSPLRLDDRFADSLPPRNEYFTGRSALLRSLQDLPAGRVTALLPRQGMGGEGKSALALEHVHRSARQYELICWLPADHPSAVRAGIADLAARLRLPACESLQELASESLRPGGHRSRWLFVLDGARDPRDLLPLLPLAEDASEDGPLHLSVPSWSVLVTSTDRRWAKFALTHEVDVFERAESVQYLLVRVPGLDEGEADLLADRVNDLPLALDQAVAWQNATGRTATEYRELFERHLRSLPLHLREGRSAAATAATRKLALEWLGAEHPRVRSFFDHWAFLAPAPITVDLLAVSAFEGFTDRASIRQALRTIEGFALARFDAERETFQTDPVVHELLADGIPVPDQPQARASVRLSVAKAVQVKAADESAWRQRAFLTPHILGADLIDTAGTGLRAAVLRQAEALIQDGDPAQARLIAEHAEHRWREHHGADDRSVLQITCVLADALRGTGEVGAAAELSRVAFERAEHVYGPGDPVALTAALGQSAALRHLGRFEEAQSLDWLTLSQASQRFERRDAAPRLLASASTALGLRLLGRFAEAYDIDMEVSGLLEEPSRARFGAAHRLARDLHGLGRRQESLDLQRRSLRDLPPSLHVDHPLVLHARMGHAESLRAAGMFEEAERVAASVAEHHARRFGTDHPNTLIAQAHLAGARLTAGRPRDALDLQWHVRAGLRDRLGAEHPFVRACVAGLAVVQRALGNVREALESDRSALDGSHTDPYYSLLPALGMSIDLYLLRDLEAARTRSAETLARAMARLGEGHPFTMVCAHNHQLINADTGQDAPVEFFLPPEPL